ALVDGAQVADREALDAGGAAGAAADQLEQVAGVDRALVEEPVAEAERADRLDVEVGRVGVAHDRGDGFHLAALGRDLERLEPGAGAQLAGREHQASPRGSRNAFSLRTASCPLAASVIVTAKR